jgi:23S rRNA pseudouridine2605 synthase
VAGGEAGRVPFNSTPRTGVARALSKLGFCSRTEAQRLVVAGAVKVNGSRVRNPEQPVVLGHDRIEVDGKPVQSQASVYLMLNKPRGLVTSVSDERGRETVFSCLARYPDLPRVIPVGRLDKASEGLLLFTNDTAWAEQITAPDTHLEKTYHVQVNQIVDETVLEQLVTGVPEGADFLKVGRASLLRAGGKNAWLEITLYEGKNRHIRRLLEVFGIEVLRLVRVAIGSLLLGPLPKGEVRALTPVELAEI